MSRKTFRERLPLLGGVVALAGVLVTAAVASGNPSASGHGNLTVGDGQTRTFSFSLVQQQDGTVTGQVEVNNPSFPIRIHSAIDCVKFVGNRVIASGPVTRTNDPSTIALGRIGVFAAEDNGEGANADRDRITTIPDYDLPKSCEDFSFDGDQLRDDTLGVNVRPLRPIEAGQIKSVRSRA